MQDFQLTLRLDTPLLMGGAQSEGRPKPADSLGVIRATEVRGLLHHFARAVIGPLAGSAEATRKAERLLFGEAGGRDNAPPTVRISDLTPGKLIGGIFPNRPGDGAKGQHEGWAANQTRILVFRFRPLAVNNDQDLPKVLWAICWIALSFGSLGNRSRRGYGSLTIQDASRIPSVLPPLPLFPETPPSDADLRGRLEVGLATALKIITQWLHQKSLLKTTSASQKGWFQMSGFAQVHVFSSEGTDTSDSAMVRLMNACSKHLNANPDQFRATVGSANKPRLASPLWVRLYRLQTGFAFVATLSAFDESKDRKFEGSEAEMPLAILTEVRKAVANP